MAKLSKIVGDSVSYVVVAMAIVSSGLVFFMMMLVTVSVLGRYFFNRPITGTIELVSLMMVGVVFLGYAYAQRRRMHIRVTVITSRLGVKGNIISDSLFFTVTLAFFGMLGWWTMIDAIESWQIRETVQGLISIPVYPAKMLIPIACILAFFQSLADLVKTARPKSIGE
ncbi:TRAP transporter small permease subunit [Chloroflexota bacterium]